MTARSYGQLKSQSHQLLRSPELDKPFKVEVDASGYTIGAVLLQHKRRQQKAPHCVLFCDTQCSGTQL